MQTILGSGGAIAIELAKALTSYTKDIRLVSRNPQKVNDTDTILSADLLNKNEVFKAVTGSSIVYITIGFKYETAIWEKYWPIFIANVIEACKENNAKLVFFDNVYMYDPNHIGKMTENTPCNPSSKKGKVRKQIADMIMNEVKAGKLTALIARSADFYGPNINQTSVLTETVFKPISKGKKASWLGKSDKKHSFTYTPDAGKATALLGNTFDAYNQVWHLPTASHNLTGNEWVEHVSLALNKEPKMQTAPNWLVRILGLFNPLMKEFYEMIYQYDRDYIFDSSKFEKRFNFQPTSYEKGIREIIDVEFS